MLGEVLFGVLWLWDNGVGTRGPVGRTDFAVLVGELEGLEQSQGLVDGSTDRQVVDGDLSQSTLWIDQEDTSESDAFVLDQNTVVLGKRVVSVSNKRDVQWAQATVGSGDVGPGQQGVLGVGGGEQDLGTLVLELLGLLGVGNDFGRTDEGERHWEEGQQDPLTLVLLEGDLFEGTADDCGLLECWSWCLDSRDNHCVFLVSVSSVSKF